MKYENLKKASEDFIKDANEKGVTQFVFRVIEKDGMKERKSAVNINEIIDFINPFGLIEYENGILQSSSTDYLGRYSVEQAIFIV